MKLYLLFLSLFLNCINLDELKNAEPMHYLTGVIVASVRGAQTSSSDQASFQIQGTLKDSSGNPIANAILSLGVSQSIVSREAVTTSTTTDANGNYTLNLKMGNFSVKVTNSSGVEIGSFRMNATTTTAKPEISATSGNMSFVVNSITSPSPISPVTVAPSNLNYSSSTLNLTVGTAMTSLSPTVTGIVTSYSVSPALPSGLSLNSSTGVISGTPLTSQSAIGYTITASNRGGSSTFLVNLKVSVAPPSNLKYPIDKIILTVGKNLREWVLYPSIIGNITEIKIEPPFNNGLIFNSSNSNNKILGDISGSPNTSQLESKYKITASNSSGSIFTEISIKTYQSYTYLNNNNGTIIQSQTGLIWQQCTYGMSINNCGGSAQKLDWDKASEYCDNLTLGNRSDWRLPNLFELYTLVSYNYPNNYNSLFLNTMSDFYWSSTSAVDSNLHAWGVNFYNDGPPGGAYKYNNPQYFRCVAGP